MIKDGKANNKRNAHPRIGKDSSHDNDVWMVNGLSADWIKVMNWLRIDAQDYKIRLIGLGLIA